MSVSGSGSNALFTVYFFDQNGNSLPQYQIIHILSASDYNTLLSQLQYAYGSVPSLMKLFNIYLNANVSTTPDVTESAAYNQIASTISTIQSLPANAGAGTVETSTFSGYNSALPNVQFTITANNYPTTTQIMSYSDYQSLQQNPQSGVSVINPTSTSSPVTITYTQLENQLIAAGVQQYVSPSTLTQASSGQVTAYSVVVQNYQGVQNTFVISPSDYIQLYSTQLSSLISSNPVSTSPTATLSQVLTFISSASTTGTSVSPTVSPTSTVTSGTTVLQQPTTNPLNTNPTPNIELDIVANNGNEKIFDLAPADAQYILNNYTNNVKNTTPTANSSNARYTDVITFLENNLSTTNVIPPGFSPQVITTLPPGSNIPPSSGAPSGFSISSVIMGLFGGALATSFIMPNISLSKHLKRKRGNKK